MPVIDGVNVPDGASDGGWYEGRQLWQGRLGPKNVIINPNQQGYNREVSREVVAQTNPDNVSYLQAGGARVPSVSEDVTPFLEGLYKLCTN